MAGHPAQDVTLAELEHDPHPALARLRERGPLAWLPALGGWVVVGRELALQVMRDPATFTVDDPRFTTSRIVGPSMLSLDGAAHDRHRRPFAAGFRLAAVRARDRPLVEASSERLLARLAPAGAGDLRAGLAAPLAVEAAAAALGLGALDPAAVLAWYAAIVDGVSRLTAGEPAGGEAGEAFAALQSAVERAARDAPAGSPLAEGAASLGAAELAANVAVILFGGIDTTEGAIANLLWPYERRETTSRPARLAASAGAWPGTPQRRRSRAPAPRFVRRAGCWPAVREMENGAGCSTPGWAER